MMADVEVVKIVVYGYEKLKKEAEKLNISVDELVEKLKKELERSYQQ